MDQPPAYSPQAISDILPIYRPPDCSSHIRVYKLRQKTPDTQILTLLDDTPIYNIKTRSTGGFMNRKPHVVISQGTENATVLAEAKFDNLGTGTTIYYPRPPRTQLLDLEDSRMQLLKTTIDGHSHWWQPHPGNKCVVELTNDTEEMVARFLYSSPDIARTGSTISRQESAGSIKDASSKETDVGELSVVEALAGVEMGLEEILCSAVVVIERFKRRAANMIKNGAAIKQGPGWGMSVSFGVL
ncbi:hypothetical protein JMJ35_001662 [Cladonia borealis]|uniref:Uncharacterized protein n=1 Tax=Cladonia borealis TaxID=184061 RepID=A0AA39R685_9LECA|nr:hypothetical protein JMJ35_001662 [Cladonia borealis]